MPYVDLTDFRGASATKHSSRISVQANSIVFRLDRKIVAGLGWKLGDKARVLRGDSEDEGWGQILRDRSTGWTFVNPGGRMRDDALALALKMPKLLGKEPAFPQQPDRLPPTEMEVVPLPRKGDGVRFRLPWYVPLSTGRPDSEPEPPAVEEPAEPAQPAQEPPEEMPAPEPVPEDGPAASAPRRAPEPWPEAHFDYARQLSRQGVPTHTIADSLNARFSGSSYTKDAVIGKLTRERAKLAPPTNGSRIPVPVLDWMRETVQPEIRRLGWKVSQNSAGTQLLLNGQWLPVAEILDRVNAELGLEADERLVVPEDLQRHVSAMERHD
jgi:hypothetical protein